MVDPIPSGDRARTLRWVKGGAILLVGLSTGLLAVQGDAPPETVLAAIAAGLLVGGLLVWYLVPDAEAIAPASRRRHRE